ncbi:MAG: amidase [Rhodospirillales bacterium]|nr:amidase [Rhodospirillales bacterium]
MITRDDYLQCDALALAGLVAGGSVKAEELLTCAIGLAEERNPGVNALSQKLYDFGRKAIAAGLPQGSFTGVPFLLKDLGALLKGEITTMGARITEHRRAEIDSTLVERYKQAGLVIFGKTATPEFGLSISTETTLTGDTRNPWDPARTAGGSSGGAAAAVAAGILPMAHASDGGGSIRIPASCCGLFGLKPTRARMPAGPVYGEGWGGLSTNHVVSRSVRDSAAALDAAAGPEPGDPYRAPPHPGSFLAEVGKTPAPLKVALQRRPLTGVPVHGDCIAALERAAQLLEDLGHRVEEAEPPGDGQALSEALLCVFSANMRLDLQQIAAQRGRPIEEAEVEQATWVFMERARRLPIEDYPAAIDRFHSLGRSMAGFRQTYDLLLSPTLAQPPPLLGPLHMDNPDFDAFLEAMAAVSPFTAVANMTGEPAMSVPLHWTEEGLPIGVMVSAAAGEEASLLRLAGQLEEAAPWWERRPAL